MSEIKINYKVIGVNDNMGFAYVKYWADGATEERFGADIGPYEIPITPECSTMTEEEFNRYIANFGISIIGRQKRAIDASSSGANTRFELILNIEKEDTINLQNQITNTTVI